ncbi:unnamed protein product [Lymnaea stagnalis]|uniref:MD-2-related lipid-recognition domain-containing protein n=1 Tax=Lymnaea stagnalis TaxID=6523 RepID=A0AAV2H7A5_LYMST
MPYRRLAKLVICSLVSLSLMGLYLKYFNRPPADVLLKMNKKPQSRFNFVEDRPVSFKPLDTRDRGAEYDSYVDYKREDTEVAGGEHWQGFLDSNNFVSIGAVYSACEGTRSQLGSVVLLEDKERGGVLARTYLNITIDHEIKEGTFHLEVKYNGQDLFTNYWELCELEDELPVVNKTFTCPVAAGKWSKVKDKHIPGYLPAGRYQTKAWAVDESRQVIACGFSDFNL